MEETENKTKMYKKKTDQKRAYYIRWSCQTSNRQKKNIYIHTNTERDREKYFTTSDSTKPVHKVNMVLL